MDNRVIVLFGGPMPASILAFQRGVLRWHARLVAACDRPLASTRTILASSLVVETRERPGSSGTKQEWCAPPDSNGRPTDS